MDNKDAKHDGKFSLNDFKSESKFEAPEGFFEHFADSMDQLIDAEEENNGKKETKVVSIKRWYYAAAGLAAACVFVLFLIFPLQKDVNSAELLLSEVSDQDIVEYLAYSDLDTDVIAAELVEFDVIIEEEMPSLEFSDDEAEALLDYYTL